MITYITFFILLAFLAVLLWLVFDLKKQVILGSNNREQNEKMVSVQASLQHIMEESRNLRKEIDGKLSQTHRATQEQISHTMQTVQGITGQSARQIADVVAGLTKLEETNKQVVNFQRNFKICRTS